MLKLGSTSIKKQRSGGQWLSYIVGQFLQSFTQAWVVMLCLGGIHHDVFPAVPALGYWQTFLVLLTVDLTLSPIISGGIRSGLREELA